jgi:hypothetical protein
VVVKEVSDDSFNRDDGWTFGIQEEWGIKIKPGDVARFYGRGIGSTVRGLDINGVPCYYRTEKQQEEEHAKWVREREAEQKAEFEKNKASLDEKYNNLPAIFQRRIDKFRKNNPDFRWKYEAYEMFCCEQAVVIAKTLETVQAIENFIKLPFDAQKALVSELSKDHSGNTFGCSVRLAYLYVGELPENVVKLHGALAPLVGSKEYGCVANA